MKVGIFVKADITRVGGGVTFERELVAELLQKIQGSKHEMVVFSPDPEPKLESGAPIANGVHVKSVPIWRALGGIVDIVNLLFARVLHVPYPAPYEGWLDRLLFRHHVEFFVNLTPSTLTREIPYLTCVWDLQHRLQPFFPEVSSRGRWARYESIFSTILKRASCVVVLGPQGNKEVKEFYGIADERIRILTLPTPRFALEAAQRPQSPLPPQYGLNPGYFFYPAQIWPHKNHIVIVKALQILRDRYGAKPTIVFAGSDQGNLAYIEKVAIELGVERQIRALGFVTQDHLVSLYQHATGLLFPSMFGPENFPPLESMALGCPVIASSVPGSRAQYGDAALLVDPTDHAALAQAIYRFESEPALRAELIEKGKIRAVSYTGENFASDIVSVLDDFAARRSTWPGDIRYSPGFSWKKLIRG